VSIVAGGLSLLGKVPHKSTALKDVVKEPTRWRTPESARARYNKWYAANTEKVRENNLSRCPKKRIS
jgi:hypothetical protein